MEGPYDNRWNSVFAGGCRDIFKKAGGGDAFFMVGPVQPADIWIAANVTLVNFTVAEITQATASCWPFGSGEMSLVVQAA